ncbi:Nif11-like leader peptide family natural product precursor [Pyxidicoccus xibeiensis]|uniref:Nif11-like leader peptide family natural product precursor n=1 Tax=Pyxidicoccus xibeiensis TaxID=2906759 RepID=UPI0020A77A47|nr:Nif11-like leader peptide family natural product precursor [Pyxidicoccus xibeiensis]MCP3137686.1 Nif11-like leader peptide family natural product precursor [Pyxidicoccus xibeiensis]
MPPDDFERFRRLVLEDRALQVALEATAEVPAFIALARKLGAERGCHFTEVDIREAIRSARREWNERWI